MSKVHGANMGPNWVLSAPDGPHVGPMNLAIWVGIPIIKKRWTHDHLIFIIEIPVPEKTIFTLRWSQAGYAEWEVVAVVPYLHAEIESTPHILFHFLTKLPIPESCHLFTLQYNLITMYTTGHLFDNLFEVHIKWNLIPWLCYTAVHLTLQCLLTHLCICDLRYYHCFR